MKKKNAKHSVDHSLPVVLVALAISAQAKVAHLGLQITRQEYIACCDVPVNELMGGQISHPARDVREKSKKTTCRLVLCGILHVPKMSTCTAVRAWVIEHSVHSQIATASSTE
jgi:hypothetical protein